MDLGKILLKIHHLQASVNSLKRMPPPIPRPRIYQEMGPTNDPPEPDPSSSSHSEEEKRPQVEQLVDSVEHSFNELKPLNSKSQF